MAVALSTFNAQSQENIASGFDSINHIFHTVFLLN